jgi:23S rRNA (adenine2503-C2)-methyltransferase
MKDCLKNYDDAALTDWLKQHGHPRFRLKQITDWLYEKWAVSTEEMRNLPLALRKDLDADFRIFSLTCIETLRAEDGTEKFLFELGDGHTIETVHISAPGRHTVCISTQVGCPVRCVFCASGRGGLVRNLTPAEIVDQVVHVCRRLGERVTNIVVMGMGEPLLNLENLKTALEILNVRLGLGARRITISTSGIVPGIREVADMGKQWNLALSLHATSDVGRAQVIPDLHRYPLEEILGACEYYRQQTGRMVTFEYTLLAGKNDTLPEMRKLAHLARRLHAKVNLIPCNSTGGVYQAPSPEMVKHCLQILEESGVQATVRLEKGNDILAACGQLRQARADGGANRQT